MSCSCPWLWSLRSEGRNTDSFRSSKRFRSRYSLAILKLNQFSPSTPSLQSRQGSSTPPDSTHLCFNPPILPLNRSLSSSKRLLSLSKSRMCFRASTSTSALLTFFPSPSPSSLGKTSSKVSNWPFSRFRYCFSTWLWLRRVCFGGVLELFEEVEEGFSSLVLLLLQTHYEAWIACYAGYCGWPSCWRGLAPPSQMASLMVSTGTNPALESRRLRSLLMFGMLSCYCWVVLLDPQTMARCLETRKHWCYMFLLRVFLV